MARPPLTRTAVDLAIAEAVKLGREPFRQKYGFGGAKDYFLVVDGKNYDSKAIVGAAYGYLPGGRALGPSDLGGGLSDAVRKLEALGYQVSMPGENADWTLDETILALDFYLTHAGALPGKKSKQIANLSSLLRQLGRMTGVAMTPKFRNANGVYMKMMNLRRFDPAYLKQKKSGLPRGAKLEEKVWSSYAGKAGRLRLRADADTILAAVTDPETPSIPHVKEEVEASEGGIVLRLHQSRERDGGLAKKKRAAALKLSGKLVCEACGINLEDRYGVLGRGYMEVHHKKPVSTLKPGEKTKLSDLALVCPNCHRMLHRVRNVLALEELRGIISGKAGPQSSEIGA